jgi:hypothetical protein
MDNVTEHLNAFAQANEGQESLLICFDEASSHISACLAAGRLQAGGAEEETNFEGSGQVQCNALKHVAIWCGRCSSFPGGARSLPGYFAAPLAMHDAHLGVFCTSRRPCASRGAW